MNKLIVGRRREVFLSYFATKYDLIKKLVSYSEYTMFDCMACDLVGLSVLICAVNMCTYITIQMEEDEEFMGKVW